MTTQSREGQRATVQEVACWGQHSVMGHEGQGHRACPGKGGRFLGEVAAKQHTKGRDSQCFPGERKEEGIQSSGNNKSHELVIRPGMLGDEGKHRVDGRKR